MDNSVFPVISNIGTMLFVGCTTPIFCYQKWEVKQQGTNDLKPKSHTTQPEIIKLLYHVNNEKAAKASTLSILNLYTFQDAEWLIRLHRNTFHPRISAWIAMSGNDAHGLMEVCRGKDLLFNVDVSCPDQFEGESGKLI
ncbi:unnamed protein product [Diplocarpon coronariae]